MSSRSAWPASIMMPAGMRPVVEVPAVVADVGLGPDACRCPSTPGVGVDAGHAIGEQQRRLRHADLAR